MPVEVEARFRAHGVKPLHGLAAAPTLGAADLGPPATVLEEDRYLDTPGGGLAAARWACRLRTRDDVTRISLKGPPDAPSDGWLHRRPEVEGPATADPDPAGWPPSEARNLLLTLSGGAPLVERLRLVQSRTERSVTVAGTAIGVLTLDVVTVVRDGARTGVLHLVELELAGADAGDADETHFRALAEALESRDGLIPEPRTKLELALELA